MLVRHGVQFRWENPGYRDFADFLATFNHDKRKKVKQERRRVADAGIAFTRKVGAEITAADWAFFYRCYENTYRDHRSTPYLSLAFFERIGAAMPGNVMLALGRRGGTAICAALDIFDRDTLWGRYWGTTEHGVRPAFRGVLLPGDRLLHRAEDRALRRRRAGRAQAGPRPGARDDLVGARDRRCRIRPTRSPSSARANASTSRTPSTSSTRRARSAIRRPSERTGARNPGEMRAC